MIQKGTGVTFKGTLVTGYIFAVSLNGSNIVVGGPADFGGDNFEFTWFAEEVGEYKYYYQTIHRCNGQLRLMNEINIQNKKRR